MADSVRSARGARAQQKQLPEVVASYIRELIISGTVRPGDFLRMEPIAEALDVSNTPVREGLFSLRSEGLVRLVPRRGFQVAEFTQEDIRDLFWAQAKLAGELAARAAGQITDEELQSLEEFNAAYEVVIAAHDEAGIANLGHEFHRTINVAAGSKRLSRLLGAVVAQLPNTFYAAIEGQVAATQQEHPRITAALKARDAERARSEMERHLLDEAERLIENLSLRGIWADSNVPA